MEGRSSAEWSEYALFGRHSSAPRTNGIGIALAGAVPGVARQVLEIALELRHGGIDKVAHFGHGKPSLWCKQMHRQGRRLILVEEDLQSTVPDLICDVIGEQAGDAVAFRGRGHCGTNRVDDEPWCELHSPRHRGIL